MRMKYVAQLVVKSVMGPMEFVGLGKRCVQVMPYLPYGWRIWPVRKCHFAYMWQIVGGVIPSNCGICTPEVAFSCYDLPHIRNGSFHLLQSATYKRNEMCFVA